MLRLLGNSDSDNFDGPHVAQICLSGTVRERCTAGYCLVELKLGSSGDLEDNSVREFKNCADLLMESSSSSGGSKRSRVSGNAAQVPSCLVDGCTSDLSKCREYHRRHKVCEVHSKTPKVYIQGQERRFCQQCSRFHSVTEFDEVKRSCRKRLEGHNRRRRKPQPDSLSLNSASLFPTHQGARYLDFGSSQLFSASDPNSAWSGAVKSENDHTIYSNQSQLDISGRKNVLSDSMPHSYRGGRQLPFVVTDSLFHGDNICQPSLTGSSTLDHNSSGGKVYSDGLNLGIDSNRALSLLSFPPANTQEIGVSQMVKSPDQSVIQTLNYSRSHCLESEPVGSVSVSGGRSSSSNATNLHVQDMFHQIEPDGSSASGSHHMLSFSWE